jgi:hypothetical protein
MNVYVFPAEGQATDQQNKDEAACYSWAVDSTGSDDAGKGAAIGAAVGGLGGRRARRQRQAQATQQIDQQSAQAQQSTRTQIDNFKKAFSVCLEAKDCMVKF